ncbi:hypothetical protein [Ornithinimicrobium murale]|uniref:hypothetical protein n=1 Tax=Ornithinimicrobium murale TaxID=1050153 RepID=UPI000E0CE6CF|nr:hypothetical protein [Ornithinimicrobium murale]
MSTQISDQARTAREDARRSDGRYGFQTAAESGVSLDDPAANDWSFNGTLDDRSVLDLCRKYASRTGHRFQVDDRDDLEGLGAEHFVRYVRNRQEKVLAGDVEPQPEFKYEQHIRSIFHGLGQRIASGLPNGGRDLTALTKWLKTRETFETKYGRPMTRAEEDELADGIRASFPPGKRPIDGFHRAQSSKSIISLDSAREDGQFLDPSTADQAPAPQTQASDDAAHQALDIVEAGGRGSQARASRAIWEVVSAEYSAPQVAHDSFTGPKAKALRTEMESLGGVEAVLDRYSEGSETDQDMDTLLAPFGGREQVDATGIERVVQTLERNPGTEAGVWDAAVLTATIDRKKATA